MKKRKMKQKEITLSFLMRYGILIIFGILLSLFYKTLFPLTIWPSFLLLNLFYKAAVMGNSIIVNGFTIEIINACIAGSAYYLLLILNLTTKMKTRQRVYSLLFSFLSLLVLNILRIFFLSILFVEKFAFFDITHKLFWYLLSVVFVVGIWFLTCWLFKIKNIPVYSDIKELYKTIKSS